MTDHYEQVKHSINEMRAQTLGKELLDTDLQGLEKRASILKSLSEAEKATDEAANVRRLARGDTQRFVVSTLAPLVTAVIAIGALLFQVYQFNQANAAKAAADQETAWRSALDNFSRPGAAQTLKSAFIFKSFLTSGSHQQDAREFAISYMKSLIYADGVQVLLPAIMQHTDWGNFGDVVDWARRQKAMYDDETSKPDPPEHSPESEAYKSEHKMNAISAQMELISKALAQFLRSSPRPSNRQIDVSNTVLLDADLSSLDLHGVDLRNSTVQGCDVAGADLSDIANAEASGWPETAWWRAQKISLALLVHLKKNYSFKADVKYRNSDDKQEDYDKAVRRLEQSVNQ